MSGALTSARSKLNASPLARRFLGGATWSVLGAMVSSGLTLVLLMLVARLLGKETYGQFVVIQSTLNMVGVFAGFGVGAAATRYVAELRERDGTRLGHILTLAERAVLSFGVLAVGGLVASADWLASRVLNAPDLGTPLAFAAGTVLFAALDGYQKSVLIGFEAMRAFAIGNIVGVAMGFPIMLLAAKHLGLPGAALAMAVNALVQAGVSRRQMLYELHSYGVRRKGAGCLSEWRVLWSFALPALLAGALVGPAHWIAQAMLANTPNGYAELAVLGIAMQWFQVILFVPATAGRVVLPILTDHVAKDDRAGSRKILLYAMTANALVAVPMAVAVGILSPYVLGLYGSGFEHQHASLVVAVATAALVAIQAPVGNLLAATARMWLGALMNAGWAAVYLSLVYLFRAQGALGVMVALGAAYLAHAVWTFWFALHHSNAELQKVTT